MGAGAWMVMGHSYGTSRENLEKIRSSETWVVWVFRYKCEMMHSRCSKGGEVSKVGEKLSFYLLLFGSAALSYFLQFLYASG